MSTPFKEPEAPRLLREAREAASLDLESASLATRIPAEQIRALEEGRYADLPGPAYARAFARTLANAYGIDSEPVMVAMRRDLGEPPDDSALRRPAPSGTRLQAPPERAESTKSSKGPVVLVLLLVVALGALIGLTRLEQFGAPATPTAAPYDTVATVTDSLPDTTTLPAAPKAARPRTVSFHLRDSGSTAFLLYVKANRVRKWTLRDHDSLVLAPDTAAFFRNLSGQVLRASGAIDVDSLADKYFHLDRSGDSTRLRTGEEAAWQKEYDRVMAIRKRNQRDSN